MKKDIIIRRAEDGGGNPNDPLPPNPPKPKPVSTTLDGGGNPGDPLPPTPPSGGGK